MAASLGYVLAQLQHWTSPRLGELSDAVLLERFVGQGDESAFAALMARHSGMVLHSCRRVLGDAHEAEDAFQATFLILARRAHTLKQPAALPGFLHSIARRVSLKVRRAGLRKRPARLSRGAYATPLAEELPDTRSDPLMQLTARELLTVLDEEVARLPEAQRLAVLLCCLEGHTREEAAKTLGCTLGSLKGHLERGRRRLQERLQRRGITLSAVLALAALSGGDAVSASMVQNAVKAALGGGIGDSAAALAHSALKTMWLAKHAGVMALTLTFALAASTAIVLVYRSPAAPSPEDKTPAIAAASKDVDADKPQARFDAHGDPLPDGAIARLGTVRFRARYGIKRLIFTPDSKRLVTQGYDSVSVWDAATGKELRHLASEKGCNLGSGDLSPDGKLVAVWGRQSDDPRKELCSVELWNVESGKKIGALEVKSNVIPVYHRPIRFSSDGKLLATSSITTDVQIWDLTTRKLLRSWQVDPQGVGRFVFSPDSSKLITDGSKNGVRLWDVATGRELLEFKAQAMTGYSIEFEAAFAPDGKLLALIEANEKRVLPSGKVEQQARISLWDTITGKRIRQLVRPAYDGIPYNRDWPHPFRSLAFTADGSGLVTTGPDHCVRIWDASTGEELRQFPLEGLPSQLALSQDGKKLATAIYGGDAICIVDVTSGRTLTPPGGHLTAVTMADLAPDGRTAVTGSFSGSPVVWDVASGKVIRHLEGHDGPAVELRLINDGRTLYTLGWDKTLRLWDLPTAKEIRCVTVEHDYGLLQRTGLPLTPDGKTLAIVVVGERVAIRILDTVSGAERQRIVGPEHLMGMRLTPNGRSLIAWSGDCKVRIWDAANARKIHEWPLPLSKYPNTYHAYTAALSPDGRFLAMEYEPKEGKQSCLLVLVDLATGRVIHRVDKSPSYPGRLLAFSPDSRMLAWTGFGDSTLRLLETATGSERRRLAGHRGPITALAFSADGRRLLSGCNDTTALVWDLGSAARTTTAEEIEALWSDLIGGDAARAYQAIHWLAASPSSAIPFIRKRLRPVTAVDEKRLARRIADLDSDDFALREKANEELQKLAEVALPAYRKALDGKPSLESRRRLEVLLEKAQAAWWDISGERLRMLRAIEALELAGTKQAREELDMLAAGASGARLTCEAKAALQRLAKR